VLVDALEEVGAGAGVLAHLQGPGPHVRGCRVVSEGPSGTESPPGRAWPAAGSEPCALAG
jgi:hypothetical protein